VDDLADRLSQIMTERGLKASEIADATGITRPVMSRYIANRSGISAENLIKLSQYLNVSPDWLLNGSDAPESIKMSKDVSVVDKNEVIAVQRELIERLKKEVKEWEDWKAGSKARHAKGKAKANQAIKKNKQKLGFLKKHKPKK
jgi:transcriptional regulator with XRE-family HTH domain